MNGTSNLPRYSKKNKTDIFFEVCAKENQKKSVHW